MFHVDLSLSPVPPKRSEVGHRLTKYVVFSVTLVLWCLPLGYADNVYTGRPDPRCSIRNVLGAFEIKSSWGKTEGKELHKDYRNLPLVTRTRNGHVKVQKGSFFDLNPSLDRILDDLNTYIVFPPQFIERMKEVGREVKTVDQLRSFYKSRLEIFRSGVDAFGDGISKMNVQLAVTMKKKLKDEIDIALRELEAKASVYDFDRYKYLVEDKMQWMKAKCVELNALGSVAKVKAYSMTIGETADIQLALKYAVEDHKAAGLTIADLKKKYPIIMENDFLKVATTKANHPLSTDETIDAISEWIRKKEVDVVYENEYGTHWLEVKSNSNPLTKWDFQLKKRRKSSEEQLMEDLEILKFLRLEEEITVGFYSMGGIDPQLKRHIVTLGAQVVE